MIAIIAILIFSMSLCADCFAVSVCSSVTLKKLDWGSVLPIAVIFGIVQSGLMLLGWGFGDLFVGYVEKIAHLIGFLLLLYVGGSMLLEAFSKESEVRDLNGLRNVIVGAVATSIDALAVGISLSMSGESVSDIIAKGVGVLVVTFLSVVVGMMSGQKIGQKFGKIAEAVGGVVLILIGLNILFGFI